MRVIFCHGDKGGAGKSTAAMLLAEHATSAGMNPFIIEGDARAPDVVARYKGVLAGASVPLSRPDQADEAVGQLLELLESNADKLAGRPVIVNLPGGAGSTVDQNGETIRDVIRSLEGELVCLYVLGAGIDSAEGAIQSMRSGLAGASDYKLAVENLIHGDPARWGWRRDGMDKAWRDAGGEIYSIPALTARGVAAIRDKGPLGPMIHGEAPGLFIVDRSLIYRWLRAAAPLAIAALGPGVAGGEWQEGAGDGN